MAAMEQIGTVVEVLDHRARVELVPAGRARTGELDPAVADVFKDKDFITARNRAGAKAGDRVRVRVPQIMSEGLSALVFAGPLAGLVAGVALVRLAARIGFVAVHLEKLRHVMLGDALASVDNLAMVGGLCGLVFSFALLSWWIKRKKRRAAAEQEIVEIIHEKV